MKTETYLIGLNAPPMGEGNARYAAITVTPEVLEKIRQCRKALALIPGHGYGHVLWRGCLPAIVVNTLPECMEHLMDNDHEGPVAIPEGFLPLLEIHAVRTELEGLEVGPDWAAFVGYEKHGDYEFTGSLPDFKDIQP